MNDLALIPVEDILAQVAAVKNLQKNVMIEATEKNPNGHYGLIPGCGDKPALLKAGAEKLALCFQLDLQTETDIIELDRDHREYRCITMVYSKNSGNRLGNGAGSCTTMETKWRYRAENTGEEVPSEYWDTRDSSLIGGPQFSTRKVWTGTGNNRKQKWFIFHRVEHDNPADYYNTCQKMAEKRSKVCAVLNVTAASDIFIQEDVSHGEPTEKEQDDKKGPVKKTKSRSATKTKAAPTGTIITTIGKITEKDGKVPYKILGEKDIIYSTYSDSDAAEAQAAMDSGMKVSITTKGDKWNTIDTIELVEEEVVDELNNPREQEEHDSPPNNDAYADSQ